MWLKRSFLLTFSFFLILWGFCGYSAIPRTVRFGEFGLAATSPNRSFSSPCPLGAGLRRSDATLSILLCLAESKFTKPNGSRYNNSAEIQKIDAEIQQLEEMKRGYEARALKHDDMATYLQFDTEAVLETRRHIQLAEENRNKAALVQEQIDRLKAKKAQLQ